MRDWRETIAPGAPTVKLDIGSRRGQKILCIPGLQLCNTKDTTAHCLLLACADLKTLFLIFRDFYFLIKLRTTILLYRSNKDVLTCSSRGDLAYTPIRRGTPPQMSARDVDAARLPNFLFAKTSLHSSWKTRFNKSKNTYLLEFP